MTVSSGPPGGCWKAVDRLDTLVPGELRTWKCGRAQLVVGASSSGEVFALDNRCPHEGYPLAQGELKDQLLTCCWHNWKFDVRDGSCVLGGEAVRRYGTRVRDGVLEVDLTDPDPAELFPRIRKSLDEGLFRPDLGQATRDSVRLLEAGYPAWELLGDLAAYDARHRDYGSSHVLALAADCGRLLEGRAGADAMHVIGPVLELCAEANQRFEPRVQPQPIGGASESSLREAVEAQDAERAEAMLLGALRDGVSRVDIERWLLAVNSDHFTDFGHPLIYTIKARELLDHVGPDSPRSIYPGLLFNLVLATREDTLPYMRPYFARLGDRESEFATLRSQADESARFDPVVVRDAVLAGSADDAIESVWSALVARVPARQIARALVGAAAYRLFRFDRAIEADAEVAENWLWATHRLTFASAVRHAVERDTSPGALRFLFQAVAFIHSGHKMDGPPTRLDPSDKIESLCSAARTSFSARDLAVQVVRAIQRGDVEAALRAVRVFLACEAPLGTLQQALGQFCLDHSPVRPIFVAHTIKTTLAAVEETVALDGHPDREMPLLAAVRFLASPIQERRIQQTVLNSIRWVRDGVMPRKLTQ